MYHIIFCSSDFARNLSPPSYNCFYHSGSVIFFNTLQRMLSCLPCYLFLLIPPVSFVSLFCVFDSLFCTICSYSLWHNLSHFCSFLHPQYLTDLEEEVRKLCVHFLQKKIFRAWFNMVREAKIDFQSKQKVAVEHNDRWGFVLRGNSLPDFTIALQCVLCLEYVWKDEVEARRAGHMEIPGRGGNPRRYIFFVSHTGLSSTFLALL